MKRTMSFVMSIITTSLLSLSMLSYFILFLIFIKATGLIDLVAELKVKGYIWVIFLVLIFVFVMGLCLLFNSLMIKISNSTHENYCKDKKFIITTIVFNFVLIIYSICFFLLTNVFLISIGSSVSISLLVANILYIINLKNEDANYQKFLNKDAVQDNGKIQVVQQESLVDKLGKLEELRLKKVISKKEFDELKKSYIAKELEK